MGQPATFLELCQRTVRECRISSTGPSAVTSQVGVLSDIVDWVISAWVEIQQIHEDWDFLRASASFTTVAGTSTYTLGTGAGTTGIAATSLGLWARETFRNYTTANGTGDEIPMEYVDYDEWRDVYLMGANRDVRTRPCVFAISPAKGISLGPVPAAGYTITGDYFTAPVYLSAGSDEPTLAKHYRMAIVWRAVMEYAGTQAPELYQKAENNFRMIMAKVEQNRLSQTYSADPLA